jgi:hypothetical protein
MKRKIAIVLLLVSGNMHAQDSLILTKPLKYSFGLDLIDGFIYATGNSPEQSRFSATFKSNINPDLRWTVTAGITFPEDQYSSSIIHIDDYAYYLGNSYDYKPEYRLAPGIEWIKQKRRFTRYLALDAEFIYSQYSEFQFSYKSPVISGVIANYEQQDYHQSDKDQTTRYGVGISVAYGYDFTISKHWSVNAESRFDINRNTEITEHHLFLTTYRTKQLLLNADFSGIISRFGLNYKF